MAAYITFSVISLHRGMPRYLTQQQRWLKHDAIAASRCRIGILGFGHLGQASARVLTTLGYPCSGWSRSQKHVEAVTSYFGDDQLGDFLARSDILVCLLALTDLPRGLLDHNLFAQLPKGAGLVHAGRGQQLNHQDLIDALDTGQLGHAIVDVTVPDPLPTDHPFWTHPSVWLTPHIASETHAESSVKVLLDNIRRHQQGRPMNGLIDMKRGY
ncbi:glyoxylate/hydroxypyruvate reductase A [Rosenbergiella sp. S61]|uniref:Glyoxylate/hydroxypyruvate reductase A n=1 Tax=Rosenbergiella gaditana TaxID=2726987 RepID=A0ABS5T0H5_9GAMM|nr:NAD(P)-dependent oxidoreductase [Rosenbergiella gaditana]MBT0725667.1 glyoxylate/hydroxypyruvate reductase A [Rosenbergiella gaditana]